MPIRKRISDPYGQDYAAFERIKKHGPAPKAPRKPSAEDRKPLMDALNSLPVGKTMARRTWNTDYVIPYMKMKFTLWGVDLAIYPTERTDSGDRCCCTGVMVRQVLRNKRTGQTPTLILRVDKFPDQKTWYGRIIHWIEETVYSS